MESNPKKIFAAIVPFSKRYSINIRLATSKMSTISTNLIFKKSKMNNSKIFVFNRFYTP